MLKFNDYLKEAALSAKQKKIAAVAGDKDKIDAADLAALRAGKKPVDEAECYGKDMKKEELVGKQHKLDKNHNGKLDAHDFKLLRKEETEELDEGKMKELSMDLKDMSHDEFHKQYGKPKSHFDPTNFKKPVEPGKGMDRAKALAQRGMQSLSKEEVERIEEKLAQLDELSPATLKSYKKGITRDLDRAADAYPHGTGDDDEDRKLNNRVKGDELASKKLKAKGVNPYSEEVEQIDELSKKTLGSYVKRSANQAIVKSLANPKDDSDDMKTIAKREKGINLATSKLAKEETEQIDELSKKTLGSYVNKAAKDSRIHGQIATDFENTADKARKQSKKDSFERLNRKYLEKSWKREDGIAKAVGKLTKEEVSADVNEAKEGWSKNDSMAKPVTSSQAMADHAKYFTKVTKLDPKTGEPYKKDVKEERDYVSATLAVMDEGKIDNLRDAQKLRRDTQSAYEKDYKPDTSHPHIQVVKGNAYGGANQKDDEGDEKPDETKEKKGRGRPAGSKSGARQKGGGHEDGGIPVHNLNLPKSYK